MTVFLYIPNLIGYGRVLCILICFLPWIRELRPGWFVLLYTTSFVLDAFDGMAAKAFNQCSRFGAVLDMVTDRFATMALVMLLAQYYPHLTYFFILANILDFVSHWTQMYASLYRGDDSHKTSRENQWKILKLYYHPKKRLFMMTLCLGHEIFYIMLYALYHWSSALASTWVPFLTWYILFPIWALKHFVNVLQLEDSAIDIVAVETARQTK